MTYFNPERGILETPAPRAAVHGTIASGILMVISGVALGIIFAANPSAAGSFTQIAVFGGIGGVSLITFVVCSALAFYTLRKHRQQREESRREVEPQQQEEAERREPEIRRPVQIEKADIPEPPRMDESQERKTNEDLVPERAPEVSSSENRGLGAAEIEEEEELVISPPAPLRAAPPTVGELRDEIIMPLIDAFSNAVKELLRAHAAITANPQPDLPAVDNLIRDAKELLTLSLDKPELYLGELLRCYGRGKNKPSIGLRRLIAAHNAGDPAKLKEVRRQYKAIARGNNLLDVAQLFNSRAKNPEVLHRFPDIMKGHFSLDDEVLKKVGDELLEKIFDSLAENKKIDKALTSLRRKAPEEGCSKAQMGAFTKEVEKFMKLAFAEAHIPHEEMIGLNERLVGYWIENQLMPNMKKMLGLVARNIRLLPSMFADSVKTEELFPQIDETFLLSESGDCLGDTEKMQKELIRLQSEINYNRKPENRVAFLVLEAGDTRDYRTLYRENSVVKICFDANQGNYDLIELQRIGNQSNVRDLAALREIRILVVPVSITDHPFKDIRSKLNAVPNWLLRGLYGIISGFIPGLVKPALAEMFPAFEPREQEHFDRFVDSMLNLMMPPIYDGAINNNSPFRKLTVRGSKGPVERRPFEEVITHQGNELANRLEGLINQKDPLSFEQIREVWVESVNNVAQGFKDLHEQSASNK